ncbi:MAG: FtsL-like putative cell division protein [Porphyromonas sp.]|nr:FtsL-like putative cell division protein [Porphyromonas sp.]
MAEDGESFRPQQGGTEDRKTFTEKFWYFVEGRILARAFGGRMILWIVAITLFAIAQVAFTYSGMRKIRMISNNSAEIQELKIAHITLSTELMDDSRISSIEERVESSGLTISTPKTAPIVIED